MTSANLPGAAGEPGMVGDHPGWCARRGPDCNGRVHRSGVVTVPADELAGVGVRVALRGSDRVFVELDFAPLTGSATALALACQLAVDLTGQPRPPGPTDNPDVDDPRDPFWGGWAPDDPVDLTDPHGHDLTLAQAEILHRALGYLLALAQTPVIA